MGLLNDEFYNELGNRPAPQRATPTQPTAPTTISAEQQAQKFGGAVGSPEYYNYQANRSIASRLPRELASTLGVQLPEQEEWDTLSGGAKVAAVGQASAAAVGRMIRDLPREIVKAPIRAGLTIAAPWVELAQGKPGSLESLSKSKPVELPWLGSVPTYFQTFEEARQSGMGPLAATLFTTGTAAGDVSLVGGLGEAAAVATRPRAKITPGQTVATTQPLKNALISDSSGMRAVKAPEGAASEYYTLPKTVVKEQFGGNTNNTFLKVTPAGEGSVELSVVQVRNGALPKAVDFVKGKLGVPQKTYEGNFGPEIKLQSKTIKVSREEMSETSKAASALSDEDSARILTSIPPKALKGFENKPVTSDQLTNLDNIGRANGIEPGVRDAVMRTITGKNVVGELTQAEYVNLAQTLGTFNNLSKYGPDVPTVNIFSQYMAPQRHWMRTYEETSGIPLYSDVYVPMEESVRLRDVFRDSYRNQAREIFGKYEGTGFGEERRLISAYMRGEKDAIDANPSLTPETKAELVKIATDMRALYDQVGPKVDVPTDIFLQDYQPRIQNIGGIHQLYKEGSEIPKELEFFAKFKRKGNLQGVQVDDALALFDIYINSGSNRLFLNPALERIGSLADQLPNNLKGSVKSYVFEKMGYAGRLEQFLDSFVPSVNQKLGINLPPDTARQFTNLTLSTMYSGLLSSPATWFRQTFQYPLFGYARLGPKFAREAMQKGLTKEGIEEVRQAGFLVDLGVPYGEELTKDITAFGRAGNIYKNVSQKVIAPNSMADNGMRSIVYHQTKMQFEDALARYNSGKITWDKFEKELDMGSLSPVDQNIIRQRLASGDIDGAFQNLVREVIDETNFPYRKGASSRIGYGLGGKLGTSLLQWPIEAVATLSRWTKTGQWDKIIRFYAASTAIQRTMQDTFGFDFTRSLFLGPFNNVYSPFVRAGLDTINAFSAFMQNNKEDFNKNSDAVVRTLKAAGIPAGVEIQNVQKFFRSYNAGPDANGNYAVLNDQKEVSYTTDFAGLFWGVLMGFPTMEKEEARNLTQDIRNAQFDRKQVKERVLELLQQEKYDQASELMAETGVGVTAQDLDDYYIPYNERVFQSLPAQLKAQFAPRVYPEITQ